VFDAYAPSHWTLPSHASLVTGLYPTENGTALASNIVIDGENETLAEVLVGSGYRAGAVIANFGVLSLDSGLPQGFNYYFTDTGEIMPPFPFMAGYFIKKFRPNSRIFLFTPYMPASSVNRRAVKWIKKNYDRPFFLLLNYMDAHDPYLPPPPYDSMWNGRGLYMNFFDPHTRYIEYCSEINAGSRQVTRDEHDFLLSQYDGAISYLDEQVGKLLGKLRELGLYDNSIIVITSDHGEFFGEHNLLQHKGSLYEEVIRVPLIVKLPAGQDQPAVQPSGSVSLVHLFHSILELAGIPHAGGRQDVDIFNGETAPVGAECHLEDGLANRFGNHTYCLIEKGAKLIISSNGTEELFDIQNDPAELDNLKEGHLPDQIESYEEFKSRLGQRIEELNANAFKPAEISADKRLRIREKLKALGYIQ
jgi:arylsulfatase A-like enzyme